MSTEPHHMPSWDAYMQDDPAELAAEYERYERELAQKEWADKQHERERP